MSPDNASVITALFPLELGGVSDQDMILEGQELDAEESRQANILLEIFPDTSTQMLSWWERVYSLSPAADATVQERQQAIVQAIRSTGGLSRDYFITLAAALGYTITIEELQPFMAGIGRAGDTIYISDIIYEWGVTTQSQGATKDTVLESLFNKLKPAHTAVYFTYL